MLTGDCAQKIQDTCRGSVLEKNQNILIKDYLKIVIFFSAFQN